MDEPVASVDSKTDELAVIEDPSTAESGSIPVSDDPPKPSKSSLKKAAKAERFAAVKLERRAREKEAKKRKKLLIAEKRAAGEIDEDEEERARRKKKQKLEFGGTVVIDLGFDDKMNEKVGFLCFCLILARRHLPWS